MKPLFEESSSVESSSGTTDADPRTAVCSFMAPPPPPAPSASAAPPFPSRLSPYVIPASSPVDGDLCLPDLGRHQIALLEKLGEGSFGALHFAELDASGLGPADGTMNPGGRKLVLLQLIRTTGSHQCVPDPFLFTFFLFDF